MSRFLLVFAMVCAVGNVSLAEEGDASQAELDKNYLDDFKKRSDKACSMHQAAVEEAMSELENARTKKHLNKAVEKAAIQRAESRLAAATAGLAAIQAKVRKFRGMPSHNLQLGQVGVVSVLYSSDPCLTKVYEVIDKNNLLVRTVDTNDILWLAVPTRGLVDDAYFTPEGGFAVVGTRKRGGSTYFYLEPYTPPDERKKVAAP